MSILQSVYISLLKLRYGTRCIIYMDIESGRGIFIPYIHTYNVQWYPQKNGYEDDIKESSVYLMMLVKWVCLHCTISQFYGHKVHMNIGYRLQLQLKQLEQFSIDLFNQWYFSHVCVLMQKQLFVEGGGG